MHSLQLLTLFSSLKIITTLTVGFSLVLLFARMIAAYVTKKANAHIAMLVRKIIIYGGITLILLTVLNELGFNLTALLGAAGVVGVALGFASQTSMSNIISGIFLLVEHAFSVGDDIKFNTVSGTVLSIDLFSVKIRTTENTLIRVPNELLLKTTITNLSHFPKRRISFTMTIPYRTDLKQVVDQVYTTLSHHPLVIAEPDIRIDEFLQKDCSLRIRIYVKNSNLAQVRKELLATIKETMETHEIVIKELYLGFKPAHTNVVKVSMHQD